MYDKFEGSSYDQVSTQEGSVAFSSLMNKVFVWMSLALVITGLSAYYVANSPDILYAIYSNRAVFWALMIAELGLVFGLSGAIHKLSATTATLMFILYSVVNGATLSSIFFLYELGSIANAFFITAGTFAVMAFIGYTTKKDLTSMGKIAMMALIGLLIATVVNIFVHSSGLQLICSYAGVLIFTGLTAYDVQKIKQMTAIADRDTAQKYAVLGALSLYLDFINIFLSLLSIMGDRK